MKIIKVADKEGGAKIAFSLLKEKLEKGAKVLGLATGSTPIPFYNQIVASDLDLRDLTSINLDEYVGLDGKSPQSYRYFMESHLFHQKPFKENFLPNGVAEDLVAETKHYDEIIANHPIDFQILGLGRNGHIGFNEPGTSFNSTTHIVDLTESTIEANSRMFDHESDVPRQAISMGIASIMKSKELVLMAFGKEKAEATKAMIEGDVTENLPASVLQRHENITLIIDESAASKLSK